MIKTIVQCGRQPAISLAEIESLFGSNAIVAISQSLAFLAVNSRSININNLGGIIKVFEVIHVGTMQPQNTQIAFLTDYILSLHNASINSKINIGINQFNLGLSENTIFKMGLEIKKALKKSSVSVRIVPCKQGLISTAQTIHNKMTDSKNYEFIITKHNNNLLIGRVVAVQDIAAYTARDQARPKRDARVGMLPPKLAQIIINLARPKQSVLDPFCGTGVMLQEALLMGLDAYGTDLEPRMVEYSIENVDKWLRGQFENINAKIAFEQGDATDHTWKALPFDTVATETYLGRAYAAAPMLNELENNTKTVDIIHTKFLKNLALQTSSGFRLCIAVPAWFVSGRVFHLKTLDSLEKIGYNRVSFVHAKSEDLIYHREGQVVGRELVTLIRK